MAKTVIKREAPVEKPTKKLKANNLFNGEYLSRTSYMRVIDLASTWGNAKGVGVENEDGLKWEIDKNVVEKECYSASQYDRTLSVTRTEIVNLFRNAGDAVFTVSFTKQNGELRELIGYLINTENEFGRSNVIDLEVKTGNRTRQVDHRTIDGLVLKNVLYVVK